MDELKLINSLRTMANYGGSSANMVVSAEGEIKVAGWFGRVVNSIFHRRNENQVTLAAQEITHRCGKIKSPSTELFMAIQYFNQTTTSHKLFQDNYVIGSKTTATPKEMITLIENDKPEIHKERRCFIAQQIKRYPGDTLDHSTEAKSIFKSTQWERLLSLIGRLFNIKAFEGHQYRSHHETDEMIYADDAPIDPASHQPTSYWLGHATLLLSLPLKAEDGTVAHFNVLTDPVEGDLNKILYPRQTRFARPMETLPATHIYLLSHNHLDHYDRGTIAKLKAEQPMMIVPVGDGSRYKRMGFNNVVELDWWQQQAVNLEHDGKTYTLKITATPSRHWAGQGPCGGHESTFLGYVIQGVSGGDIYFAGDTARLNEDHIAKLRDNFNIRWNFQPGGPDEVRKDMESTHQASVDALWMHFKVMAKRIHRPDMSKQQFIDEAKKLKTIFMHTMTFKLGNLHLSDTKDSVERVITALEGKETTLKSYEDQVYSELSRIAEEMRFSGGEQLSNKEVADLLKETVAIPKIGSRIDLNAPLEKEKLFCSTKLRAV